MRTQDFTGRDQINIGEGSHFALADTRVLVAGRWLMGPWVKDLHPRPGQRLTVRGIARVGGRAARSSVSYAVGVWP